MLQSLGFVLELATTAAVIVTVSTTLFENRGMQIFAGAIAGAWTGVLIDATLSRAIENLPVLFALFAMPLVVTALGAAVSRSTRERLLSIPRRLILGVNIFRAIGFLFVGLTFVGQLGGPFPWSAGVGDVITGVAAIPLALREPRLARNDARLVLWNAIGLLDLVVAVALGVTSRNGSPIQLIHAGAGSAAITQLPWALIPLFLVPCYMIGHVIVFAQMRETTERVKYAVA